MSTRLVITVLTEDAPVDGLCAEHGLSVHIAYGDLRVLLDFGQSDAFACNADALGIDLACVDAAVLSHAHYDHADGMPAFFARNDHAPLYLSAACEQNCWSTKGGTTEAHFIGIQDGLLDRYRERLHFVPTDQVTSIAPGVHLVPHTTPHLDKAGEGAGMLLASGKHWVPDSFEHEQTLVFELDDKRLAVFSSCSHAGLAVIANEVKAAFPWWGIAAYVGGLHLVHATDNEILRAAEAAKKAGIARIHTAHCTGTRALDLLQSELPGCVDTLYTGCVLEL